MGIMTLSHVKHQEMTEADQGVFSYGKILKQKVPCPICSGTKFGLLGCNDRYGMGIPTVHCKQCGLILTNPMPTEEAIDHFYKHHYRFIYRKPESPSVKYIEEVGLARRASYTVDFLSDHNLLPATGKVLDFGCAEGGILKEIKTRFPSLSAVGIEPAKNAAEFTRTYTDAEVFTSLEELIGRYSEGFQLIILNHVLEHVRNPILLLKRLKDFLAPGSPMYIDVPDVCAYSSLNDFHIAHLYHFSPRTLKAVVHCAGLEGRYIGRHVPPHHPHSIRCVTFEGGVERNDKDILECGVELSDNDIFERIRSIHDGHTSRSSVRRSFRYRIVRKLEKIRRWLLG